MENRGPGEHLAVSEPRLPHTRCPLALQNVSFSLSPGKVTALVGPSGSGKSSCVNILENFYPLQGGRVLLDGQPISAYDHKYLHRVVSGRHVPAQPLHPSCRACGAATLFPSLGTGALSCFPALSALHFSLKLEFLTFLPPPPAWLGLQVCPLHPLPLPLSCFSSALLPQFPQTPHSVSPALNLTQTGSQHGQRYLRLWAAGSPSYGLKTLEQNHSWRWWHMSVILALRRLRPEDCMFETSLGKLAT